MKNILPKGNSISLSPGILYDSEMFERSLIIREFFCSNYFLDFRFLNGILLQRADRILDELISIMDKIDKEQRYEVWVVYGAPGSSQRYKNFFPFKGRTMPREGSLFHDDALWNEMKFRKFFCDDYFRDFRFFNGIPLYRVDELLDELIGVMDKINKARRRSKEEMKFIISLANDVWKQIAFEKEIIRRRGE